MALRFQIHSQCCLHHGACVFQDMKHDIFHADCNQERTWKKAELVHLCGIVMLAKGVVHGWRCLSIRVCVVLMYVATHVIGSHLHC